MGTDARPRILLVATRSADRHLGGSAMRAATARRGLERLGDVTCVLVDEQPPDRPLAQPDPGVVVMTRAARGLPYRWSLPRAVLSGRGPLLGAVANGTWKPPDLPAEEFDLAWFVKAGAMLAWPGPLPSAVVLDVDDLEEDTRTAGAWAGLLDERAVAGLRARLGRSVTTMVACSEADAARLPAGPDRAVVPNAVPAGPGTSTPPATEPNLLFVGVLGYPPNRDGLVWFVRQVLPLLRVREPRVSVRVVGPGGAALPDDVRTQVTLTGPVADLTPEYAWARAVVVPLLAGSGTRVKILDALAHARAVVSTTAGVRGLPLAAGTDLLVADGTAAFADACLDVLAPGRAEQVAGDGRAATRGPLSADAVEEQVAAVAGAALRRGDGRPGDPPAGRLWVDLSTVHGWTGTPHGIARVEAGLARALGAAAPQARAAWVGRHGLRLGTAADLRAADDGRAARRPGFDPARPPAPTAGSRLRGLVGAAARLPDPVPALVRGAADAGMDLRDARRHRRLVRQWASVGRPGDVVLVAGNDWTTGTVHALAELPAARRPGLWVVVHDLVPLRFPQLVMDPGVGARFTAWLRIVTSVADGVVAPSQATADDLAAAVAQGLIPPPRQVVAVHPALDLAVTARRPPAADLLASPYVVYVATIEARKNHAVLLEAVRAAAARGERTPTVVLVGSWGWGTQAERAALAQDPALRERVVHLDGCPDDQVRWLVENAAAAVYPSRAEGYGLPVAEARALGTPVIVSDLPALREASGGDATFLDPDDVDAWRSALVETAARPPARRPPVPARTWADAARELLAAVYGGAVSTPPPT